MSDTQQVLTLEDFLPRNAPCPCSSGKRYKHCHGAPSLLAALSLASKRMNAREFQRERQQGRGKPIISTEIDGVRFIVIGNRIVQGKWQLFSDFLISHLKNTLGMQWGQAEQAKPRSCWHPVLDWCEALQVLMNRHKSTEEGANAMPQYGAASAVLGLAYDLYLIEHHISSAKDFSAFERLLDRLRHKDQFFGARHEARAAGMMLRAGFEISWQDEHARTPGGHAEFIATFPSTKRSFWVECKMRQGQRDGRPKPFTQLVTDALRKSAVIERIIFVELNIHDQVVEDDRGGWPAYAVNQLRILESQPGSAALPPAIILFSNYPEHRRLSELPAGIFGMLMEGFKRDGYELGGRMTLHEAIRRREENPEIEALWQSLQEHSSIPTTFDGSIYGLDGGQLLIGQRYMLDDGSVGTLDSAVVIEQWGSVVCLMCLDDGTQAIYKTTMSDAELDAWHQHPETFFGQMTGCRAGSTQSEGVLSIYDLVCETYADTPKEMLLEFMVGDPEMLRLQQFTQPELVKYYAYGVAASVAEAQGVVNVKAWQSRLRKRPRAAHKI
ncbi:SEC-C domain-containing protein [Xanthomonas sacchari]|uniref:YecA family protein n=1 Tax=Xanthomonas sacchari TaxID=56458 RepID=UPI002253DFCF|nr:SEC-C domain-containing protein [Xanthomonas sacchari]MCW0456605.1 hypothetical protein [Xanthomonas sacchari]